eukprot:scaffold33602_cov129-Isochrysis_galbana.AAC.1
MNISPKKCSPMNSSPKKSIRMNSGLLDSGPMNSSPVNSSPVNSGPMNSGPMNSSLKKSSPVSSGPMNSSRMVVSPLHNGSSPKNSAPGAGHWACECSAANAPHLSLLLGLRIDWGPFNVRLGSDGTSLQIVAFRLSPPFPVPSPCRAQPV